MSMSALDDQGSYELVIAPDGSIPADQLARLGLEPGAHLRVVPAKVVNDTESLEGTLTTFPDVSWEDFERASDLAKADLNPK
jgi:hypothetical protein